MLMIICRSSPSTALIVFFWSSVQVTSPLTPGHFQSAHELGGLLASVIVLWLALDLVPSTQVVQVVRGRLPASSVLPVMVAFPICRTHRIEEKWPCTVRVRTLSPLTETKLSSRIAYIQ